MYCKNCGNELPENANVCPDCGEVASTSASLTYPKRKSSEEGTAGLVLGIIGLIAWIIPIIAYPIVITGLVLSIKQLSNGNKNGKVIVGVIFCSISLVAALINSISGMMMANNSMGLAFIF